MRKRLDLFGFYAMATWGPEGGGIVIIDFGRRGEWYWTWILRRWHISFMGEKKRRLRAESVGFDYDRMRMLRREDAWRS